MIADTDAETAERRRKWRESGARYRSNMTPQQKQKQKERNANWKKNNRERWNKIMSDWRRKNRDHFLSYIKLRRTLHPELTATPKFKAYQKAWKARNRDRINCLAAARRMANPESARAASKKWREKYPEKHLAGVWKRLARLRSVPGEYSGEDIKDIFRMQNGKCAYCKKKISNGYHIDHIFPLSRGGSNFRKNLQLTCASCNLRKGAKDPISFARETHRLL